MLFIRWTILLLIGLLLRVRSKLLPNLDPDSYRNAVQMIESRGFKAETHYIITEDGYILTTHRIINPEAKIENPKVIILQHGLTLTSRGWLVNTPGGHLEPGEKIKDICEESDLPVGDNLGFELSKRGFDVWMPNTRGSAYSRNHTKWSIKGKKFWRFSFDQMVDYDLPAYIEYIRKATNVETVAFIGHSEGGFVGLGLLASKPEYNEIVKPLIGLGPVYALHNFKPVFGLAHILPSKIINIMTTVGGQFFPHTNMNLMFRYGCRPPFGRWCELMTDMGAGYNTELHNTSRFHVYLASPSQTSMWNMAHYVQLILYNYPRVDRLDLGTLRNLKYYGTAQPPFYHMDRITSKYVSIIYSTNDWMVSPRSIDLLLKHMKVKPFEVHRVKHRKWNHMDFIYGMNAGHLVYSKVMEILKRALCE